jgi:hypothetical protein
MTATPTRRRNDGPGRTLDPRSDRAARMLLLEDVLEETASTPSSLEDAPDVRDSSRSVGPFVIAFMLALVLAGGSWILAGGLSRSEDPFGPTLATVIPVPASVQTGRATDLLLRLETSTEAEGGGTVLLRREVMTLEGEVRENLNGGIKSILIDASHLRTLIETLEIGGLATLEVVSEDGVPPIGVQSADWKEWSDRLRVRRALRRAERLGGTLRLGVEASSRS